MRHDPDPDFALAVAMASILSIQAKRGRAKSREPKALTERETLNAAKTEKAAAKRERKALRTGGKTC